MKVIDYPVEKKFFHSSEAVHSPDYIGEFHTHSCYELGLVVGGSGAYEAATRNAIRRIPVWENIILFWDGTIPHRAVDKPGNPLNQIISIFDHEYIKTMAIADKLGMLFQGAQPVIVSDPLAVYHIKFLLRKIMTERRAGSPGHEDMIFAMAAQVLVEIYRTLKAAKLPCQQTDPRVRFIINDISANYNQPHSLNQYAAHLSLTPRRLSAIFRAGAGKTFTHYLHELRIERAKEMLAHDDKKIAAIAFEVGFENLSHFNKLFKSLTGSTPDAFRKHFKV